MAGDGDSRRDEALVRAFQEGNRGAFDALVKRHHGRIFNLCFRMLGDSDEANDLAQETFIKAFNGLKRFRFEASFSTWLYRIAVNACKNRMRLVAYRLRRNTLSTNGKASLGEGGASLQLKDGNPLPLEAVEAKERALQIQEAILSLSPEHRAVVLLRDMEGLSYEAIADVIGKNLGTVKSRLSRARQILKEKLRGMLL